MTPVVRCQRQVYAVYFDLSDALDLVPRNMTLHKFSSFGFSDAYVSLFRSYLTKREFWVRVSGTLSLCFQVTPYVLQGCVLRPFVFEVFINNLRNSVNHCQFLIFAHGLKIFRIINSPHD
jgi:hypothetical protein